jgi:Spy/CpxP family protein refolding chaperone
MGHAMDVMAKLKLTDQQKQQVHELMMANQSAREETMVQMRKLHEQLRDQLFADAGPSGDTAGTVRQINEVHEKMLQSQVELHEQVSKVLDPEQRKMMRSMPMPGMMGMMEHGPAGAKKPAPKK